MIHFVENTLRDGSYVIDFQFNGKQTYQITKGLHELGFQNIEVGHGLGLGAWNQPKIGLAKENDRTYIQSAKKAAPSADIVAFFIPGIGTEADIDIAVEEGLSFLRVGTNVDTFEKAYHYAAYAKRKGLKVAINLMKSYGVKSYEFTQIAQKIEKWGVADVIYLVDSAGCMLPHEVHEYIARTKERVSTHLGFHGHNNLSMAAANSIEAMKGGATYIDTCIRGMGRSAGNAQTEIVVYLLQQMGMSPINTDIYDFYAFAETYIVPIMPRHQGLTAEEVHIGISRFHSSYMPLVKEVSKQFHVDEKVLIKNVSDVNCINPSKELFIQIASKIQSNES